MKIDLVRMALVMDYLQRGGEVYYEGRTLVWLDEHIIAEDEKQKWVIDGLAIKGKSYESGEDLLDPRAGKDHYLGHDMSMNHFGKFVNNMSEIEYKRILQNLAKIKGLIKA